MSDSKTNTGQQDRLRVDANDASEVEYLHQQYPHLAHETVRKAIQDHGPLRADIKKYLDARGKK